MPQLLALFSRAFPGRSISEAYYRWQFLDNPICPFSSVVAERGGRIIAHAGYSGRRALLDRREGVIFVKGTSMSDPVVRSSGVYSRLLSWADRRLATRGAELVLSYPNTSNHPLQILRPDYIDIYQIPALIRRAREPSATEHSLRALAFPDCFCQVDGAVELLGRATFEAQRFGLMRTAQYLAWRYRERPGTDYFMCQDQQGGTLRSLLIWKYYPAEKPDRIMIVEWLSAPEDANAATVLDQVESLADAKGLAVYIWQNVYGKFRHKLLERRGYTMGAPILYFGAFPLVERQLLGSFDDYRHWHVAMGDVDIF